MKLFLSALCASFMVAPLAFAEECEKGKCDKEKKEDTVLAGKCKDGECDKDKEEGTLAGKCKDGECDKEKAKEEQAPIVLMKTAIHFQILQIITS